MWTLCRCTRESLQNSVQARRGLRSTMFYLQWSRACCVYSNLKAELQVIILARHQLFRYTTIWLISQKPVTGALEGLARSQTDVQLRLLALTKADVAGWSVIFLLGLIWLLFKCDISVLKLYPNSSPNKWLILVGLFALHPFVPMSWFSQVGLGPGGRIPACPRRRFNF